jgi:hypothetical protein
MTINEMLRCDICNKFISYKSFDHGATRKLKRPDNEFSSEDFETICSKCNAIQKKRVQRI